MFDMTIELRTDACICLYEQIYEHIKSEIREGKLLCGERLPSTRSLAEYLQISRSTVDSAYEQLLSEGYIESKPYRGYFVCQIEDLLELSDKLSGGKAAVYPAAREANYLPDHSANEPMDHPVNYSTGHSAKYSMEQPAVYRRTKDSGVEQKSVKTWMNTFSQIQTHAHAQVAQETANAIVFHPNGMDMSRFPFGTWQRINRNVLSYDNRQMFTLGHAQGDLNLRTTISRYLHISRGVECGPEQIIVGAGNDYLLMLLEKILGRHIPVAMEYLSYKRVYRIFQSFAYPVTLVGIDEQGMKVDEVIASRAKLAYVMPAHQYPTGTVMPIGRRMELLKWASKAEDRYIIEDDYDSEFRYKGKPIPSLQASDKKGKVIYIGTFSKAIAPAIRVSYMVLPEGLLQVYKEKCWFYSSTVSRIDQRILNEFISGGYFERYLNKARKLYKQKHEILLEALKPFSGKFKISGEHAGLHLLLTSLEGKTEEELVNAAESFGVKVYGLSEALIEEGRTKPQPGTVLLGYGGLNEQQILEGIERLKKAWL